MSRTVSGFTAEDMEVVRSYIERNEDEFVVFLCNNIFANKYHDLDLKKSMDPILLFCNTIFLEDSQKSKLLLSFFYSLGSVTKANDAIIEFLSRSNFLHLIFIEFMSLFKACSDGIKWRDNFRNFILDAKHKSSMIYKELSEQFNFSTKISEVTSEISAIENRDFIAHLVGSFHVSVIRDELGCYKSNLKSLSSEGLEELRGDCFNIAGLDLTFTSSIEGNQILIIHAPGNIFYVFDNVLKEKKFISLFSIIDDIFYEYSLRTSMPDEEISRADKVKIYHDIINTTLNKRYTFAEKDFVAGIFENMCKFYSGVGPIENHPLKESTILLHNKLNEGLNIMALVFSNCYEIDVRYIGTLEFSIVVPKGKELRRRDVSKLSDEYGISFFSRVGDAELLRLGGVNIRISITNPYLVIARHDDLVAAVNAANVVGIRSGISPYSVKEVVLGNAAGAGSGVLPDGTKEVTLGIEDADNFLRKTIVFVSKNTEIFSLLCYGKDFTKDSEFNVRFRRLILQDKDWEEIFTKEEFKLLINTLTLIANTIDKNLFFRGLFASSNIYYLPYLIASVHLSLQKGYLEVKDKCFSNQFLFDQIKRDRLLLNSGSLFNFVIAKSRIFGYSGGLLSYAAKDFQDAILVDEELCKTIHCEILRDLWHESEYDFGLLSEGDKVKFILRPWTVKDLAGDATIIGAKFNIDIVRLIAPMLSKLDGETDCDVNPADFLKNFINIKYKGKIIPYSLLQVEEVINFFKKVIPFTKRQDAFLKWCNFLEIDYDKLSTLVNCDFREPFLARDDNFNIPYSLSSYQCDLGADSDGAVILDFAQELEKSEKKRRLSVLSYDFSCFSKNQVSFVINGDSYYIKLLEPQRLFFVFDQRCGVNKPTSILKIIESLLADYFIQIPSPDLVDSMVDSIGIAERFKFHSSQREEYLKGLFGDRDVLNFLKRKLKEFYVDTPSISDAVKNFDHEVEAIFLLNSLKDIMVRGFMLPIPALFPKREELLDKKDGEEIKVMKVVNSWFLAYIKEIDGCFQYFKFKENGDFVITKCDPFLLAQELKLLREVAEEYNIEHRHKEPEKEAAAREERRRLEAAEQERKRLELVEKNRAKVLEEQRKKDEERLLAERKGQERLNREQLKSKIEERLRYLGCAIDRGDVTVKSDLMKQLKDNGFGKLLGLPSKGAKFKLSKINLDLSDDANKFLQFDYARPASTAKPAPIEEGVAADESDMVPATVVAIAGGDVVAISDSSESTTPSSEIIIVPLSEEGKKLDNKKHREFCAAIKSCLETPVDGEARMHAIKHHLKLLIDKLKACGSLYLQGGSVFKEKPKDVDLQLDMSEEMEELLLYHAARPHFLAWIADDFLGGIIPQEQLKIDLIYKAGSSGREAGELIGFTVKCDDMLDISFTSKAFCAIRDVKMNDWISALDARIFDFNIKDYRYKDTFKRFSRGLTVAADSSMNIYNPYAKNSYLRISYQKLPHTFDDIRSPDFIYAYRGLIIESTHKAFKTASGILADVDNFILSHRILGEEVADFKRSIYCIMIHRARTNAEGDSIFCQSFARAKTEGRFDGIAFDKAEKLIEELYAKAISPSAGVGAGASAVRVVSFPLEGERC